MDPRTPSRSEEEVVREENAGTGQVVKKTTNVGPTQTSQQTTQVSHTPTGQNTRTSTVVGMSAGSAQEFGRKKTLYYVYQVLWYVLGFVEIVLALRFILKLLGANPDSGFAGFIYGLSQPFAGGFSNLFHASTGRGAETTALVEWSTLIAMGVYALVVWGIVKLLQIGKPVEPDEMTRSVDSQ